jgi:hypothetical protein
MIDLPHMGDLIFEVLIVKFPALFLIDRHGLQFKLLYGDNRAFSEVRKIILKEVNLFLKNGIVTFGGTRTEERARGLRQALQSRLRV